MHEDINMLLPVYSRCHLVFASYYSKLTAFNYVKCFSQIKLVETSVSLCVHLSVRSMVIGFPDRNKKGIFVEFSGKAAHAVATSRFATGHSLFGCICLALLILLFRDY